MSGALAGSLGQVSARHILFGDHRQGSWHHRPLRVANPFYSRGRFDEAGERGVNG